MGEADEVILKYEPVNVAVNGISWVSVSFWARVHLRLQMDID